MVIFVFSMTWIILGHTFFFSLPYTDNPLVSFYAKLFLQHCRSVHLIMSPDCIEEKKFSWRKKKKYTDLKKKQGNSKYTNNYAKLFQQPCISVRGLTRKIDNYAKLFQQRCMSVRGLTWKFEPVLLLLPFTTFPLINCLTSM